MRSPSLESAVRRIRSLAAPPPDGVPDKDLLRRFLATRDEPAFAALVARHGPAVLGVCRRVLTDRHAAEDAFQATFLVLARRASSIQKSASVGCWLHGVAYRVATRLKGRLARRPRPGGVPDVPVEPRDDVTWKDVRRVLDEEVNRLPDRLRLPVLLCYFEGKTRDEAAEALGWKLTTLRGRLEDGRQRLRARLALRGVELSAALLAVSAADAFAIEDSLIESAVRASRGAVSDPVKALAGGIGVSGLGRLKLVACTLLVAIGLGTTALVYRGEAGETPKQGPDPKQPDPAAKDTPPVSKSDVKPPEYGEPAGDFRLRLRRPGPLRVGDSPELVCDLKFIGKEKRSVFTLPEQAAVELDGCWYHSHREGSFAGKTTEFAPDSEHAAWLSIKPDTQWLYLRDKTDADDPAAKEAIPFRLTAGTHTLRVACTFGKGERAISNAVTIDVATDGWGNPAGGMKARARFAKTKLKPGDPLEFELDLRNDGRKSRTLHPVPFHCEIDVGGVTYRYVGPIDYESTAKTLKTGDSAIPFVAVKTDANWKTIKRVRDNRDPVDERELQVEWERLALPPGKQTVRVAWPLEDEKLRVVSNPVEIEVEAPPLDPALKPLVLEADRIWVVPSPTREKPVPAAEHVLKGSRSPSPESLFDLRLLPGDDPKKKWLVFLSSEEEGRPTPVARLFPGPKWFVAYDEMTATIIHEALLPTAWGEPVGGLQMGLRLRQSRVAVGGPVVAEVTIRNVSKEDKRFDQHRMNIYDYWPETKFRVTPPTGADWVLEKPTGKMSEEDIPHPLTLKPGESYIHSMRLERWPAHTTIPKEIEPRPSMFTEPGEYAITCLYAHSKTPYRSWTGTLSTKPVKLTVTTDVWGDASGGMQARVRLVKPALKVGDALAFEFDLRNRGDKTYVDGPIPLHCDVELDGRWYRYSLPISYPTSNQELKPGGEWLPYVKVTVNEAWQQSDPPPKGEAVPFKLTPGRHALRVAYPVSAKDNVKPISQRVEFEVTADAQDLAALATRADRIIVGILVEKDGKLGLKPSRALKGPNNRWRPDVQQLMIPHGTEPLPADWRTKSGDTECIFFLKAEEDGVEAPKLTPAAAHGWFRSSTPEEIKRVLDAIPKLEEVGKADHGLSLALRPASSDPRAGEEVRFDVVLKNEDTRDLRVLQHRYNVYDYWPLLTFTVTLPNGEKVTLAKPEGEFTREDFIDEFALKPGERYLHAVRLDRWPVVQPDISEDRGIPPFAFCLPGTYKIQAVYKPTVGFNKVRPGDWDKWPFWSGELASNVVSVEVKPAAVKVIPPWGEEVAGLEARLHVLRNQWPVGKWPVLGLELRNRGGDTWLYTAHPAFTQIEVDGAWYTRGDKPIDKLSQIFKPGGRTDQHLTLTLDHRWTRPGGGGYGGPGPMMQPPPPMALELKPGRHTVRAAYLFEPKDGFDGKPVRAVSNVVEIEIGEYGAGPAVRGVRARLRPVQEKWQVGDSPRFDFDLINESKVNYTHAAGGRNYLIELDGVWYENEAGRDPDTNSRSILLAGDKKWKLWFNAFADRPQGGQSWVLLTPDDQVRPVPESRKLKLTPGKHTIRVRCFLAEQRLDGGATEEFRVETNAVEFEIEK